MKTTIRYKHSWLLLIILTGLVFTGCQPIASYYRGYEVNNDDIISLTSPGAGNSIWKTFDLSVNYRYEHHGQTLVISGDAKLSMYYEVIVTHIKNLDLYLFFVDENSKVLETVNLANAFFPDPNQILAFDKRLTIPENAHSFAFGYRGQAIDKSGGEDPDKHIGGGWIDHFDKLPTRSRN